MADGMPPTAPQDGGLVGAARRVLSTVVAAVETRIEILVTEVQEERIRLTRLLILGAAGLFCLFMGIALFAVFMAVLFWDTNRLAVLGLMCGMFLGAGVVMAIGIAVIVRGPRKPLLAETRDVLAKDRQRLEPTE